MVHILYFNGYCRMRVIKKFLFHVESVSHTSHRGVDNILEVEGLKSTCMKMLASY